MFKNLFSKLFSTYLVITILTLVIVGGFLFNVFEEMYFDSKTKELESQAQNVADLINEYFEDTANRTAIEKELNSIDDFLDAKVWVIDAQGEIIAYTRRRALQDDFTINQSNKELVLNNESVVERGYHPSFDDVMLTVAVPINISDYGTNNKADGAVFMHAPVVGFMATISQKRQFIFYAAGIAILCSMVAAYFLSRSISKPLFKMNRAAMEMADGNFDFRVPVKSRDEVGQLSGTFNHLAEKLQMTVEELQQEKEKLESILNGMGEGVLAVDINGEILMTNNLAYELLSFYFHESKLSLPSLQEAFPKVMEEGETLEKELNLDDERTIFMVVTPLQRENGDIWGGVAVLRDVTEIRRLENIRRDFVANVSHELRTPLTSIRGFLEALIDGLVTDEETEKRYLQIIMDEALRLDRLIKDLLDLSKIESEKFELEFEPVELENLVEEVRSKLMPQIEEKNIRLVKEIPSTVPKVWANKDRISQVIMNLLDNAISFSYEGGEVRLGARYLDKEEMVEVYFSDNGRGIPDEELDKIWQRFHKVEKSRNRSYSGEGTGLGLSIVKHLVESHGGSVNVKSRYGQGSVFRFTLKVAG